MSSSSDTTTASATTTILATKTAPPPFSPSLSSSGNSSPPPHPTAPSPCAACKILRRRCTVSCLLAPFFPPTETLKFTTAHRVFGAGNIIKLLQDLPESRRADAVNSMVYEANARVRDRVYGCAGVICHLQKHVDELQEQLARAQAKHVILQAQHAQLLASTATARSQQQRPAESTDGVVADSCMLQNGGYCVDDCGLGSVWEEPRWA